MSAPNMTNVPAPKNRDSVDQDQFLTILSREDALARFEAALFPRAILREARVLADALGRALADDIVAPIDVPPFDRSNVDGFAVRSADLSAAGEATPVHVALNDEVIACGIAPLLPVLPASGWIVMGAMARSSSLRGSVRSASGSVWANANRARSSDVRGTGAGNSWSKRRRNFKNS